MADAEDKDDRTEEPTQRKLEQAREKGDIVYSQEVGATLSLIVATLVIALMAAPLVTDLVGRLRVFLVSPHLLPADPGGLQRLASEVAMALLGALGIAALGFAAAGAASRYVQDRPTFTAQKLKPSFDKIDPIKGFGRIFGPAGLSQFLKAIAKLLLVGAALAWALWPRDAMLETAALLDLSALLPLAQERAVGLLIALCVAAAVIGGVDYLATRQSYMKRQRMSRREIKDELRQSEGDPMVRMKLRQIRMERARGRMMAQVPNASVVITNPTHFAVALRYEPGETAAPVCLAKGTDEVAFRIRALAEEHAIPIVENPPLARALFASADLDQPIPREHYEAVAKVIGYVMGLAARRRRPTQGPNQ